MAIAVLAIFSITNMAFASVKSNLTSNINSLETKYNTLKTTKQKELTDKVTALNTSYSNIFTNLGYDDKVIEYLESLWKLKTNFKENLLEEYNITNAFITEQIADDTTKITSTKNTITFDDNITDTEKSAYETSINNYNAEYNDLASTIDLKINALDKKYSDLIKTEKSKIQGVVEDNLAGIKSLDSFLDKYNALTKQVTDFKELYQKFNDTYLAYSSDLTALIDTKEKFYVDLLDEKLTNIKESNIKTNATLKANEWELIVHQNKLTKDFKLSLAKYIDDEYFVLYSKKEVDRILENYDSITTKFVDSEGKIRSTEVINDKNAFEQLETNSADLKKINDAVNAMMDENSSENTLENMKVKIENKIIKYYNDNFMTYIDDMKNKIKEKLSFFNLQNTDWVIISELLTLKYENLFYRVLKENTYTESRKEDEINRFLAYLKQYYTLKNSMVDKKINSLSYELEIYKINKRLDNSKFNKYISQKSGMLKEVEKILAKFDSDLSSENYRKKMDEVEGKVDALLKTNIKTSDEFMILVVKLALIKDRLL